jgi:hypothetical protein
MRAIRHRKANDQRWFGAANMMTRPKRNAGLIHPLMRRENHNSGGILTAPWSGKAERGAFITQKSGGIAFVGSFLDRDHVKAGGKQDQTGQQSQPSQCFHVFKLPDCEIVGLLQRL